MIDMLAPAESDQLWWHVVRAVAAVADEVECLVLAPVTVRDTLYGTGCLESYRALLDELAALADELAAGSTPALAAVVSATPEIGETEWLGSDERHPRLTMTWHRLTARVSLARALRRQTPQR